MSDDWNLRPKRVDVSSRTHVSKSIQPVAVAPSGWIRARVHFVKKGVARLDEEVTVYKNGTIVQVVYVFEDNSGKTIDHIVPSIGNEYIRVKDVPGASRDI